MKLIAELSANFLDDMKLAEEMIAAAAENGADYVKFQTWNPQRLKKGAWDLNGRREQYLKSYLTFEKHELLKYLCEKYRVEFLTSCFSVKDIDMIRHFTPVIKIPGVECANRELVDATIEKFDLVYLSICGTKYSVYSKYLKNEKVYLMHGVYTYPCPYENANLSRLFLLKRNTPRFGYSGHCLGPYDAIAAISLGAQVVEKHFTIDQKLPFRDNAFSILPENLALIHEYRLKFEQMMIDRGIDNQECEKEVVENYPGRWDAEK